MPVVYGVYVTKCLSCLALGCEYNTHELNYVFFLFWLAVDNDNNLTYTERHRIYYA
jgi:hypothetical protein